MNADAGGGAPELARLRHDLRTPLNQIIGYSELVLESAEDEGLPELESPLKTITKFGQELLVMLNDAMSPWHLSSGGFVLADLQVVMEPTMAALRVQIEVARSILAAKDQAEMSADLAKIERAVDNLKKTLSQGIAPDVLTTPRAKAAEIRAAAAALEMVGRLLVVDDDMVNRELMSRRLKHMGFQVAVAADGSAALETLAVGEFDLVLLDILMPGIDGFATLERIKANPAWERIPVIMLTALDDAESTGRCIAAGAEDYAAKPFNTPVLRARISAALEKKRLRESEQVYLARIAELEAELAARR